MKCRGFRRTQTVTPSSPRFQFLTKDFAQPQVVLPILVSTAQQPSLFHLGYQPILHASTSRSSTLRLKQALRMPYPPASTKQIMTDYQSS